MAATVNKHATQTNASLQQLAANATQLHQQQQAMMNQMAMMTMSNGAQAGTAQQTFAQPPTQIYQPATLPQYQQGYSNTPQQFGGRGGAAGGCGGGSRGGQAERGRGQGTPQVHMPPMPYVGGNQLVPSVPRGQHQPNKTKHFSNQNVCYSCGFDVKDWHMSATCPYKKQSHQNRFTRANYMQYEQAGYPFAKRQCTRQFTHRPSEDRC